MSTPDDVYLILSPDKPGFEHTRDSVRITADCGCRSWISQSGMNMVFNPLVPTKTVCMEHADRKALRESVRQYGMRAVPGAKQDLTAELGAEATEELYRRFNLREL